MKKILTAAIIYFLSFTLTTAKEQTDYSLKFNGQKYHLLYSVKNKDFGGYLNEYYRRGETYNIWTDMVAVHHFPNAYSPIDRIQEFKEYLSSLNCPSSLTFDDKKNTAMIDFVIINDNNVPIVLEFNVFKYEKSKKCGSIAIQYTKRYSATNMYQIEAIKKEFEKNRKSVIKKLKKFEIPTLVTKDIDKCISASSVVAKTEEKTVQNTDIAEESENKEIKKEIPTAENNSAEAETEEIVKTNADNDSQTETKADTAPVSEAENIAETIEPIEKPAIENNDEKEVNSKAVNEPESEEFADKVETELKAPVPDKKEPVIVNNEENVVNTKNKKQAKTKQKKVKQKKTKQVSYQVTHNSSEYVSKPRTKKELKKLAKEKKKAKKQAIKRVKNASKKLAE